MRDETLLEVKGLKKYYPIRTGALRRASGLVKAVDDVSFHVRKGETLGLVGESGCGKTTTGRCILRAVEPTDGRVLLRNHDGEVIDVRGATRRELRRLRRDMQLIFQDPYASLDARMPVKEIIGEPLLVNGIAKGRELEDRVAELMRRVGLRSNYMCRYPHAFSGGQRQRISIARALALNPSLVVCDEPVSALDVSIQAQILNLLLDLQQELKLAYLFIAHDLSVVEHISDRIAVMYVGGIVEIARTDDLFARPRHPYTEALLSAIPQPDPQHESERLLLQGEIADPAHPPEGCLFHPRCRYAAEICRIQKPGLTDLAVHGGSEHLTACHRANDLDLRGVEAG